MNKTILILIILGILVRLFAAFLPGFKIDMDAWFAWALRLNEVGFAHFYSPDVWTNYTPGYLYILAFLGAIKNVFSISDQAFTYLLKIPGILAEIALGILIYKEVLKHTNQKLANLAAVFILLNPALIFNSSVWGQIDSIPTLFIFLSIYFLSRNSLIYSSISYGVAFLIKPQAIAFLPIFFLFSLKRSSFIDAIKIFSIILFTIFLLSFPFFPKDPIFGLPKLFFSMVDDYPYTSLNAYNFWGILGFWISDRQKFNIFTYQQIGHTLYFFYWILLSYFYLTKRLSLYSIAALAALGLYFLPTRIHDRYLYPAIPFLVLTAAMGRPKTIYFLTALLSVFHLFNLYFVYIYYEIFYHNSKNILYLSVFYSFIEKNGRLWSVVSSIIFLALSYFIIKIKHVRKNS